jgi:hypothetical protein
MKKNVLVLSSILVSSVLFTGCATLFGGGGSQQITISSNKSTQVDIGHTEDGNNLLSNYQTVTVPGTVTVLRENKDILIKTKNGKCKPVIVKKETNSWVLGDVLALSLLSTTVDAVTGAMWEYDTSTSINCDEVTIENN